MLSDIVSAISTACDTLTKTFVFGTIAEDINKYSNSANEIIFLQIPFRGTVDESLLTNGDGYLGYTMDIYALRKFNQSNRTSSTKQAEWDAGMNSLLSVMKQACTDDRNLKRSITGQQTHNEILRFGNGTFIASRITINFSKYWKCS